MKMRKFAKIDSVLILLAIAVDSTPYLNTMHYF